ELRTVQVCVLDGDSYRVAALYTERDIAKVRSLEGCYVDLSKVFE
ncbi:MAG: Uma2 family endonuclease, partial [Oscillibacter sp.]|nr:Uma2 family endonuclease [Oscillibacter sp.]